MLSIPTSPLQQLFNQATDQVLAGKWTTFSKAVKWQDILPCPELSALPKAALPNLVVKHIGILNPSEREQQLAWSYWAADFFTKCNEQINQNLHDIEQHLTDELAVWNKNHSKKNEQLSFDKMLKEWLTSVDHLSLREFTGLYISADTAYNFLKPKFDKLIERYGMRGGEQPPFASSKMNKALSLRQIALLYIYEDKVISRGKQANKIAELYGHKSGERLNRFYNGLRRTNDRTGVDGRQIKHMIKDLKTVISHLVKEHKQQAEEELRIIIAKSQD